MPGGRVHPGAGTAGTRYLVALWTAQRFGTAFPYGTLLVNAIGSFLLGAIMHVGVSTELLAPNVRIALAVGVLGGFTTYSSFSWETLRYLQEGAWGIGFLYVASTLFGCLVACALGFGIAKWLFGA